MTSGDEAKANEVTVKLTGLQVGDVVCTPTGLTSTIAYITTDSTGRQVAGLPVGNPDWHAHWFVDSLTLVNRP